jgi:hypothetical protein
MAERQFKTEEDVYRELGRELGRAPNRFVWGLLQDDRWPSQVVDTWGEDRGEGESEFAELVEKYRRTERYVSESGALNGRRRRVTASPEQTRIAPAANALAALSEIMALEAQSHPLVIAFRERVLGGSRLQPEGVTAWRLEHDAGLRQVVHSRDSWPRTGARENAWEAQIDAERYAAGDLDVSGGEADFMACVVDVLRDTYGWHEWSDVARFVLSGEPPHLASAIGYMRPRERFFPTSASVHLIVNPQMEPRRLMELYARMRRSYMPPNTRIRPPGEQASRLAVFAARHNDGSTWQDVWAAWNAESDRQYADPRSFARDARKAYRMVTGEDLDWHAGHSHQRVVDQATAFFQGATEIVSALEATPGKAGELPAQDGTKDEQSAP